MPAVDIHAPLPVASPVVELRFDLWHLAFVSLITGRAPPNFDVQSEVRLTIEPQRADLLLLRRIGVDRKDEQALVLRALWPRLGRVAIVEYKSPVDSAYRPGDLIRLVTYGGLYETAHLDELPESRDLTLALVVASVTPTLMADLARKGWGLTPLGGGYARIDGPMYDSYLVVIDEVTEAERDSHPADRPRAVRDNTYGSSATALRSQARRLGG